MTDKTGIYSARVPKEVIDVLGGVGKRKVLETLAEWVVKGDIAKKDGQLVISRSVDTQRESVDTEPINYCEGCPYIENALDTSKFDEVCEFKGLDRQKAIDKCAQMLWNS